MLTLQPRALNLEHMVLEIHESAVYSSAINFLSEDSIPYDMETEILAVRMESCILGLLYCCLW
jgi:hypothetical protein